MTESAARMATGVSEMVVTKEESLASSFIAYKTRYMTTEELNTEASKEMSKFIELLNCTPSLIKEISREDMYKSMKSLYSCLR